MAAALAGQRRLVEDGRSAADDAVDRHDLARLDQQPIAGLDGGDRGDLDCAAAVAADLLRCPAEERRKLAIGAPFSVALEGVAGGDHRRDDGGGECLAEQQRSADGEEGDDVDAGLAVEEVTDDRPGQVHRDDEAGDGPRPVRQVLTTAQPEGRPDGDAERREWHEPELDQAERRRATRGGSHAVSIWAGFASPTGP